MITTVITLRAPGMTMFRMPIFTWNILITSVMILLAFPILTAALLALLADRRLGAQVYAPENSGPILWQHLFWFFGHPEVYIVALPFFGIVTEVIPVFSRKPLFGYKGMVGATIAIMALSMTVWAHHMFATGAVLLPFFSFLSYLIAIPTGIKFFNWIGTMWKGSISFETPMLWAIGFLVTFLLGGLTGVLLASPPIDFHLNDSYFLVAHFHYVLFGTIVFAVFAGIYFWFPKFTGRYLDEKLGKLHFWGTFVGFQLTFLVQHWLGAEGMARRYADYLPSDGFTTLNTISTVGRVPARHLHAAVPVERLPVVPVRRGRDGGRPVGPRQLAGVGDLLPAATAQLHHHAADPVRTAGVRGCTTRSWPSGWSWRRTLAAGRSARRTWPARRPGRGRARRTRTRPDAGRRCHPSAIKPADTSPTSTLTSRRTYGHRGWHEPAWRQRKEALMPGLPLPRHSWIRIPGSAVIGIDHRPLEVSRAQ